MDKVVSISEEFREISENFTALQTCAQTVQRIAEHIIESLSTGGKVMFCGNGGSAADSQHLAAEFMGRYLKDRRPLPALALTVDTSALTAISNDYGYTHVFERQLRGIARSGDVLVGLSTSGRSQNVVSALETAKELGLVTIAFTGTDPSPMSEVADLALRVPANKTNRIQEMHIAAGHVICGLVEDALC